MDCSAFEGENEYEATNHEPVNTNGATMDNQPVSEFEEIIQSETEPESYGEDGLPEGVNDGTSPETNLENIMDERYGSRNGHYNLWPQFEKNTDRWNHALLSCYAHSNGDSTSGIMLTEHNFHQGLKFYGKAGETAVSTQLE